MPPVSCAPPVLAPRVARTALLCAFLLAGAASPAWAKDCFIKVQVAGAHPAAAPHAPRPRPRPHPRPETPAVAAADHPQPEHHVVRLRTHRRTTPRVILAAQPATPHRQYVESSLAQRSVPVFELRPTACDTHPASQSVAPGAPATAQKLLDAIAGPAPTPPAPVETPPQTPVSPPLVPPLPVVTLPDTATPPDGPDFPGFPGVSGPGPFGGFPGVVGPLPPPVGPPVVGPPVVGPPVVGPPVEPPVVTPPGPPPPTPPGPPPIEPPVEPPGGPTPLSPPTPPGVPEPAAWAMLMLGFLALGGALRARRRAPAVINR